MSEELMPNRPLPPGNGGGEPPPPRVRIFQISPIGGALAGGIEVTLRGSAFQPGAEVFFGSSQSPTVTVDSATMARAVLPAATQTGTVPVSIINPDGTTATLTSGFTYVTTGQGNQAQVLGVEPLSVIEDTDTQVTLRGFNLIAAHDSGLVALRGPSRAGITVSSFTSSRDDATGIESLTCTVRVTATPSLAPQERMAIQVLASRRAAAQTDGIVESSREMFVVLPKAIPVPLAYTASLNPSKPNLVVVTGRNLGGCSIDLGGNATIHLQRSDDEVLAGIVSFPANQTAPQLAVRAPAGNEVARFNMSVAPSGSAGGSQAASMAPPSDGLIGGTGLTLTAAPGQQVVAPTTQDAAAVTLGGQSLTGLTFDLSNFSIQLFNIRFRFRIINFVRLVPFFDGGGDVLDSPVLAKVGRLLRLRGIGLLVALRVEITITITVVIIIGFRNDIWGFGLFNEFPEFPFGIGSLVFGFRVEFEIEIDIHFLTALVLPDGRLQILEVFDLEINLDFSLSTDGHELRFGRFKHKVNFRSIGPFSSNLSPCDGRFQLLSENGQTVFPDAFGGYQSFYFVRGAGQCCLSWNFDFDLARFTDGGPETTVQHPFNADFCLIANPSPNQMNVVVVAVNRVPNGFPPALVLNIGEDDILKAMAQPVDANGNPTGGPRQDLRDLGFHVEFFLADSGPELDPTRLPDGNADALLPGQDVIRAAVTSPPVITEGGPADFGFWSGGVLGFSILNFLARGLAPAIRAGDLPVIVNALPDTITVTPVVAYEDPSGTLHEVTTIERAEPFENPQASQNNPLDPKKYVLAVKVIVPSNVTQDQTLTLTVSQVAMSPTNPLANIPDVVWSDNREAQQGPALFFSGNLARANQQGTVPISAQNKPPANQLLKVSNLDLWPNNKEVRSGATFTAVVPPGKSVANRDVQLTINLSLSGSGAAVALSRSQLQLTISNEETFEEYLRVFYQATDILNGSGSDAFFNGFDAAFYNALKANGATTGVLNSQGAQLWDHAWQNAQTLKDDRPLYWARIRAIAALRTYGKRQTPPITGQALASAIKQFELPSRGLDPLTGGISFVGATPGARKAIVTGFDPFALPGEPKQSNPSGLVALSFNAKPFGSTQVPVYVRTAIFPVRYKDFDDGLVETAVEASIGSIVLLMTVSQGRNFYDVERFAGKNRGRAILDNNRTWNPGKAIADSVNPTVGLTDPEGRTIGGAEFIESTLPYGRVITSDINTRTGPPFSATSAFIVNQHYWIVGAPPATAVGKFRAKPTTANDDATFDKKELPDPGSRAIEGSGENFLSNEIFYRTALVRSTKRPSLASGHLHIPPVNTNPQTLGPGLLNAVETALNRFLEDRFRMRSQGDVTFPKTAVGRTSAPLGLTAVNETNETITIGTVEIASPQSFALQTPLPIPPVSAGATLTLQFTFSPQAVSVQTSNVVVRDTSNEILFTAKLTGEGIPLPPAPQISSFDPTSGMAGDAVDIFGANLDGATAVRIGTVATTFTVISATEIIADVTGPPRVGQVSIDTPSGTAVSSGTFRVVRPPRGPVP